MNRRKKGGFAAGCCVALLLITLCAAAGGGVLWYVGRTMAQPGSASMQGTSGAPGGGAEDTGRQEPLFREGDTVDTVLAKMTLAEKVGQMFIVRCPEQGAAEKAAEYHLGGYILFRENFEEKTPVQAAEMVRACQAAAALPEGEAEQQAASAEAVVEAPVSEAVEVAVEAVPEVRPEPQEAPKDVRPGRRARAERKTRQVKKADPAEVAKASKSEESTETDKPAEAQKPTRRRKTAKPKAEENPAAKKVAPKKEAAETAEKPAEKRNTAKKTAPKKAAPKKTAPRKKKPAGDTPAGYIRELVADAGAEGIMLSTITDAVRAKFKDFKVRDLGYSQMRQYMASVGDYDLEKSGRNFRVRLAK